MSRSVNIPLANIVRAWRPNAMSFSPESSATTFASGWLFLTDDPREANTEGGIFPAIFGTVLMVLLMSVLVTPFGVIAAVYLHEYARQGAFVRLIQNRRQQPRRASRPSSMACLASAFSCISSAARSTSCSTGRHCRRRPSVRRDWCGHP